MNFLQYIDQTIANMLADIKGQEECIAALESAKGCYQDYLEDCEYEATKKPREAPPAEEATEVAATLSEAAQRIKDEHDKAFGPVTHAIVDAPQPETKKFEPVDLRNKKWSPERKAAFSAARKELWAKKKGVPVKPKPPVPLKDPVRHIATNTDTSKQEPPPAWRGQADYPPDIVTTDACPLSMAGAVLFDRGKYISHLDKEQKAVMERLLLNFQEQTLRVEVKDLTKSIDRTISELRGVLALTETKIETTNGGWKLVAVKKETV